MRERRLHSAVASGVGLLILGLVMGGCGSTGGSTGTPGGGSQAVAASRAPGGVPGRYIVVLKDGVNPDEVIRAHGVAADLVYKAALKGFAGELPPGILKALERDGRVKSVEPDQVVTLVHPVRVEPGKAPVGATAKKPPGGGEPVQPQPDVIPTGVDRIDADLNARIDVSSVGIAIIDTGIDLKHPDLNVAGNVTFVQGTRTGADDNGHGTHVAGIAAAKMGNGGVRGVAPNAKLYAVKVLDRSGSGYLSWIIAGVNWVTQNAAALNIKVANMSLGGLGSYAPYEEAINNSVGAGVTYVVAAGNNSADAAGYIPASYESVICVSAMGDSNGLPGGGGPVTNWSWDDDFAIFSNFGAVVDMAAPGVDIYSTYRGGTYATMTGTSMASPHVAGAAALYSASHPGASPAAVAEALKVAAEEKLASYDPSDPSSVDYGFANNANKLTGPLVYAAGL